MNELYVSDGVRPDLAVAAKVTQSDLRGYAFAKVFPVITTVEKSGDLYVAPKTTTNQLGQAGRSDGSAITTDDLATLPVAYTTARVEGRARIYEHEMHSFADMNAACAAGGKVAGRRALNKVEALAMAQIFTTARKTAATTLANHAVVSTLQKAAKAVRAYGKAYLVLSDAALQTLCEIPEIRWRLTQFAKVDGDIGYLALNDEKVRAAVSTILGFYGIAMYDSDIVGSTNDSYIAVVAVRPETVGAPSDTVRSIAKTDAMFGATFVHIPSDADAETPFRVSTAADRPNKANLFDAEGWLVSKPFVTPVADQSDATKLTENGGAVLVTFDSTYTEYQVPVVNVEAAAAAPAGGSGGEGGAS